MLAEQQVAEVAAATDDLLDEPITIDGDPVRVVSLPAGAKRIELGHRLEMARYLVSLDAQRALEPAIEKMSARYADLVGAHRAFAPTMQNAAARFAELAGTDRLVESIADSMSARFGDIAGVNRMVEQMGETMSLRHGLGQYAHLGRPAVAGLTEPIGLAATKQVRETLAARLGPASIPNWRGRRSSMSPRGCRRGSTRRGGPAWPVCAPPTWSARRGSSSCSARAGRSVR